MRNTRVLDIAIITGLLILLAITLAPVMATVQRSYGESKCQSNLKRLAEAISAYAADHRGLPMNQERSAGMSPSVQLSPVSYWPSGYPRGFSHGFPWVELLSSYVWSTSKSKDQDWLSVFRCPRASLDTYPAGSTTARVTYVLNYNLCTYFPGFVRNPQKVFMIREVDRQVDSLCRPTNISTRNSAVVPQYPFLNSADSTIPTPINSELHGNGSQILFADGHVQHFTIDYFPDQSFYSAANCWDAETGQWWNYAPGSGVAPPLLKSIAITP